MPEYQPNSHRSKEQKAEPAREKRVKPVVTDGVTTRKNNTRKLSNIFISEDAGNVKEYVFMDVLVPAVKKAISDIVRDGIDMILYGETGRGRDSRRSGDRIAYHNRFDEPRRRDRRDEDRRDSRSRFDYDDLSFSTRGKAELVRDRMLDIAEEYGVVRVADMYDLADLTAPYTSNDYGWMGLRYIEVKRGRDGYYLQLPKAMPID